MKKNWTELQLSVPGSLVDLLSEELIALGAQGVVTADQKLDTFVNPGDPDYDEVETIKAYFEQGENSPELRDAFERCHALLRQLAPDFDLPQPHLETIGEQDWAEGWKQHFEGFEVGSRLRIQPSWEAEDEGTGMAVVRIDPGMAFGTGSHETTRLCLDEIGRLFDSAAPPDSVLDVGTGSGILAIAAAALGAREVLGCEIDEQACEVARENVRLNPVASGVRVTSEELESLEGRYDLVVANILAEENVRLARELIDRTETGGHLVLSGILAEKEAFVREGFAACGLTQPQVARRNDWICMTYQVNR